MNYNHTVLGRLDSIFWGVLAAYLCKNYFKFWIKIKRFAFILGILILLIIKIDLFSFNIPVLYKSTITSITVFLLLPYCSEFKAFSEKKYLNFVTYISLISYSIYLVNSQVSNFLSGGINWDSIVSFIQHNFKIESGIWSVLLLVNFVLFFIFTILISTLIYKYYEVPMTKLRDLPFFKNKFKKTLN